MEWGKEMYVYYGLLQNNFSLFLTRILHTLKFKITTVDFSLRSYAYNTDMMQDSKLYKKDTSF
jgi:hypothetical protein